MVCKLHKSIYGLKQAFRQWYLKFDEVITPNSFKESIIDQCIYMKVSGSKYISMVLYFDDILLPSYDTNLLVETKQLLFGHFDIKEIGGASYVLGIHKLHNRPSRILRLSPQTYIECMQSCSSVKAPILKDERFSKG